MGRGYSALILPPSQKSQKMTITGSFTLFLKLPPPHVALRSSGQGLAEILDVAAALVAQF
jgi:hypothetical protein